MPCAKKKRFKRHDMHLIKTNILEVDEITLYSAIFN
jgi:hypothetical protein